VGDTAHALARAMVAELIRGRLANASIEVVQTVGWLMMMRSEPPDPSHFIGRWFASLTDQDRQAVVHGVARKGVR
jgi:hypothetical protein